MADLSRVRFRRLEKRVSELESRLISQFLGKVKLSNRDYDLINSYLVLCHAEIENYVEDLALEVISKSRKKWTDENKSCHPLAALMLYAESQYSVPESFGGNASKSMFEVAAIKVLEHHEYFIRTKNHGVKKKNILRIFLPLGMLQDEFNDSWLDAMDLLGRERGNVAHSSARRLQRQLDARAAKNCVEVTMPGLQLLAESAVKLHRR